MMSQKKERVTLKVEHLEDRTLMSANQTIASTLGANAHVIKPDMKIVNQKYDGSSSGAIAQQFGTASFTSFSAYEFDDFTTTSNFAVKNLKVPGVDFGSSAANVSVIGVISTTPDFSGTVMTSVKGKEIGTSLKISFGGQILPAGSYWVTAYVVRPLSGSQWFWDRTTPVRGSQEQFYNPGGGFGFGTSSIPGSAIFGTPGDMAFKLTGTAAANDASTVGLGTIKNNTVTIHAPVGNTVSHTGTVTIGNDASSVGSTKTVTQDGHISNLQKSHEISLDLAHIIEISL